MRFVTPPQREIQPEVKKAKAVSSSGSSSSSYDEGEDFLNRLKFADDDLEDKQPIDQEEEEIKEDGQLLLPPEAEPQS